MVEAVLGTPMPMLDKLIERGDRAIADAERLVGVLRATTRQAERFLDAAELREAEWLRATEISATLSPVEVPPIR